MLVVNLRNMSENKINAGEFLATFKIRSMGYLHSGKLQDCLRPRPHEDDCKRKR